MLQGSRNREKAKTSNHGKTKAREKEVNVAAERPNIHAECNRCDLFGEEWYVSVCMGAVIDANCYSGSYTLQIFWKGDPGVENFIIKHTNEERLDQWSKILQKQRGEFSRAGTPGGRGGSRTSGGMRSTATTEFAWMVNSENNDQVTVAELSEDEDADDTVDASMQNANMYTGFSVPRNGSNASLRSRSTTGESLQLQQQPQAPLGTLPGTYARPAQRYPQPGGPAQPPLTLVTGVSPLSQLHDASYFSPVSETPMSTRVSSSSSQFPFPRTSTPGYSEENRRFTPPSGFTPPNMSRSTSREGAAIAASQAQFPHHSQVQATNRLQRPSLPGIVPPAGTLQQNRMRSASSPNIHHLPSQAQLARSPGGAIPPMPTVPSGYVAYSGGPAVINRSQNNSPTSPGLPIQGLPTRSDSPSFPENGSRHSSTNGISSVGQAQVKLKVNYGNDKFVIIVPFNIPYFQLMDRIERKVKICGTGNEVPTNLVKIKYQDEDGDYISMNSDDDVLMAFDVSGEPGRNDGSGITGVVTLYVTAS